METSPVPYKQIVFVCTHEREEGRTACSNPDRGANRGIELVEHLRAEVKRLGLKGKVRVARSGCMDVCERGPNIMIFDHAGKSHWLHGVKLEDLPEILQKYFKPDENSRTGS